MCGLWGVWRGCGEIGRDVAKRGFYRASGSTRRGEGEMGVPLLPRVIIVARSSARQAGRTITARGRGRKGNRLVEGEPTHVGLLSG
jgi:hypothetical protein